MRIRTMGMVAALAIVAPAALAQHAQPARRADPRPNVEPKADDLLHRMSSELAGMKAFSFETRQVMEVVTREGEKIQSVVDSTAKLQRPNKLRTERRGALGGGTIYYDGKTLSIYGKRDNLYASAAVPPTLDEAVDFARDKLSIDAPGADLLHSDAYAVLMEDVVSGRYLGEEPVGDRMCHHLAYRGNETDWQIWIEDGPHPLPCRFVINSKKETGSPEYQVDTFHWKAEAGFPADTFTFTPPPDAMQIKFVTISDIQERQEKR